MPAAVATQTRTRARSSLSEYRRKRDFTKTAEPPDQAVQPHRQPVFTIQEHHARRLHWDFRLEADGVLKSWAVTKVPTLSPAVRRLAVRTEDHPLAYADFQGDIPAGQYGAGQVILWDHGTYDNLSGRPLSEALEAGKAEFQLHGRKLQGKFALIRMKGSDKHENWLLLKMKDEYARAGEAPENADQPRSARIAPETRVSQTAADPPGRAHRPRRAVSHRNQGERTDPPQRSRRAEASAPHPQPPSQPFQFTHIDKVLFPDKGYTKRDVLRFYAGVARLLLPHLRDRPITLERLPEGVRPEAPHFWQKNTPSYYPNWLPRIAIDGDKPVSYALVNDEVAQLYLVNQGALTFHPWLSRVGNLDHPDFVLFDLDPGATAFSDLITIAKQLHRLLDAEGVESFVKTSGKSGLHVLVPWKQRGGYDEARDWALAVARRLTEKLPDLATVERRKSARGGKAYVDVMQNARGHHVVPPYVVRAVPAATVSTPLHWRELTPRLTPGQFDLQSALRRFERQEEDLMQALAAPA
jgi:bifunctional non-homologous end joining protein LigD